MDTECKTIICPICGYANNSGRTKCESCYYSFNGTDASEIRRKRKFQFSYLKVSLICIAVAFLGYFAYGGANPNAVNEIVPIEDDGAWRSEDHSEKAYYMICDFVKEKCATPGTTVFPKMTDPKVTIKRGPDNSYEISAYVECDNRDGKRSRAGFSGVVTEYLFAQWKAGQLTVGEFREL